MLVKEKRVRKVVTNEEFKDAWLNSDNQGILRSVTWKLSHYGVLDEEEVSSCEMMALWKCLSYHDNLQQKFTTSLFRFIRWECDRQITKKRKSSAKQIERNRLCEIKRHVVDERDTWATSDQTANPADIKDEIKHYITKLPYPWQQTVLRQYYLEGLSYEAVGISNGGYSKEAAKAKVEIAVNELRALLSVEMSDA